MITNKHIKLFFISLLFVSISCRILNIEVPLYLENQNEPYETTLPTSEQLPVYEKFDCIQLSESFEVGWVTCVIDGDSIKAKINGKEYEIRYIGINTPEYHSPKRIAAEKATSENKSLVEGKKIYLFKDFSDTDKYDRLLRYVFTDEFFINYELVKRGLAESKAYPPDISCQELFNQAEN